MKPTPLRIPDDAPVSYGYAQVPTEFHGECPKNVRDTLKLIGNSTRLVVQVKFDGREFHFLENGWNPTPDTWEADAIDVETGEIVRLTGRTLT